MRNLALALLISACAVFNPGIPTPKAMLLHEYPDSIVKHSLVSTDGIAMGTVNKIENDWEYDVDCHFPTQFLGCKTQSAWRIEIKGKKDYYLWAFPIPGQHLPIEKGMQGIFLTTTEWIIPVAKCEHMGQFTTACLRTQGENAPVILDTLDIFPLSDSTRVDSLRKALHLER